MSTVTIIWSTIAACSLLLAFMYGVVWALDRKAWSSLVFSLDALALVGTAVLEMQMMTADSPESWGMWVRWIQIPIFLRAACIVIFIRLFFGTGRPWLMWTIIGMRLFIMVTGFIVDPNFNFSHIDSIARVPFLGDQVTVVGVAGARNLQWIATLELMLMLVYVADASIQLWRRGDREARRKVLVIGVAAFATNLLESLYSQLMILMGLQQLPVAARLVIEVRPGLGVGRDVGVDEDDLVTLHRRVALGDVGLAVAQRLHLGPGQRNAGLVGLFEEVVEPRAAVFRDQLANHLRSDPHPACRPALPGGPPRSTG